MKPNNETMRQAMRLMQAGDLNAATQAIQRDLVAGSQLASRPSRHARAETAAPGPIIDAEFRVLDEGDLPAAAANESRDARHREVPRSHAWLHGVADRMRAQPGVPLAAKAGVRTDAGDSCFQQHRFACDAGELDYKLYIPAGLDTTRAPLLLMLHGCTQSPDDFSRGTRMNQLAGEHGYVVAWPAQSTGRNQNRCWNWFRGSDQKRGQGEPAILAAMTRQLVATHRLDARRVYVAGLSAGGAMAAVLAHTHPDVFAAIGVHSGLPIGLASDVPSAFAAMRKGGGPRRRPVTAAAKRVPAIVFHGDGDNTVNPLNGDGVIDQSLGNGGAADAREDSADTVEQGTAAGGRRYTRTVHRSADGDIAAEHWVIHGAAHAWSGGDATGTYTDPGGPDASAQMLRFFADCSRRDGG